MSFGVSASSNSGRKGSSVQVANGLSAGKPPVRTASITDAAQRRRLECAERTEVPEESGLSAARNQWRAPSTPRKVQLWAVLRDSRGGTAFVQREVDVVE